MSTVVESESGQAVASNFVGLKNPVDEQLKRGNEHHQIRVSGIIRTVVVVGFMCVDGARSKINMTGTIERQRREYRVSKCEWEKSRA